MGASLLKRAELGSSPSGKCYYRSMISCSKIVIQIAPKTKFFITYSVSKPYRIEESSSPSLWPHLGWIFTCSWKNVHVMIYWGVSYWATFLKSEKFWILETYGSPSILDMCLEALYNLWPSLLLTRAKNTNLPNFIHRMTFIWRTFF